MAPTPAIVEMTGVGHVDLPAQMATSVPPSALDGDLGWELSRGPEPRQAPPHRDQGAAVLLRDVNLVHEALDYLQPASAVLAPAVAPVPVVAHAGGELAVGEPNSPRRSSRPRCTRARSRSRPPRTPSGSPRGSRARSPPRRAGSAPSAVRTERTPARPAASSEWPSAGASRAGPPAARRRRRARGCRAPPVARARRAPRGPGPPHRPPRRADRGCRREERRGARSGRPCTAAASRPAASPPWPRGTPRIGRPDRHRATTLREPGSVGLEQERRGMARGREGDLAGLAVEHEVQNRGQGPPPPRSSPAG